MVIKWFGLCVFTTLIIGCESPTSANNSEFDVGLTSESSYEFGQNLEVAKVQIISKNDEPVTVDNIYVNRGNCPINPYSATNNVGIPISFGEKIGFSLLADCSINDVVEVSFDTDSGSLSYNF